MTNPGPRCGPGIDRAPTPANMEITTRISGPSHQDWRSRLACRAISARSQVVDPEGLVVLLFDLPFELPHCLSASPQFARAPANRIGDPGYCSSPNFHERQRAPRAVKRTKTGNLGFCAASTRNSERHLLMPAAFGDDVRSGRWTRGQHGRALFGTASLRRSHAGGGV